MATRPWVSPDEVKSYSDYSDVQQRTEEKLKADIFRAECRVIDYCNNKFGDEYPKIPEGVRLAVMLIAEAYAHNAAVAATLKYESETHDDYSYKKADTTISVDSIDLSSLLDEYTVVEARKTVTIRLRRL